MSALATATPASLAAGAQKRAAAKADAAARWAANDRLRRSLEGRLNGASPRFAGPIRGQLQEVKRLLRQDGWAVGK